MTERVALMGWNNPAMRWKELERRLSGLPGADDAPVSRRKRASTEARSIERPAAVTPYAELHCHSHFSFLDGASSPGRAGRGGRPAGPARPRDHRPRRLLRRPHAGRGRGRRTTCPPSSAPSCPSGSAGPQNGVPDPEGSHLLVLARGRRGLPPAGRGDDRRPPARRREGPSRLRPRRAGRARARPLGGAHRLPQGRGPAGARDGWRAGGGRGARPADVALRPRARARRALPAPRRRRHQRLARRAGRRPRPRRRRRRQRPPRHPAAAPARLGDGGRARPAQPGRARRLARPVGLGPPAQRGGDGRGAARRYPRAVARSVTLADELAFDLRKASPALPKRQIPEGHTADSWLRVLAERGFAERYAGVPHEREARERLEHELRVIAEKDFAGYFVIVHDIVAFARERRHPVPGPRLRGELGGLLRPRHHRGRRGLLPAAVRAVHLRAPRRGARHRRRLRLRPARGGHPVGLRHLRPPQRRPGGQRHRLPPADGGARRRQGARASPRASRTPGPSRSTAGSPWSPATRATRRARRARSGGRARRGADGGAAPPRHPLRRDGPHRAAHRRGLPHRARRGWTGAPCCSGTRTPASRWAWSSSTCSGWACSARSTT